MTKLVSLLKELAMSACLQRAFLSVGLGVAKVIAKVDPREVGPGQEDILLAEHQLGTLDAQEVGALCHDRAGHCDQEEDGCSSPGHRVKCDQTGSSKHSLSSLCPVKVGLNGHLMHC